MALDRERSLGLGNLPPPTMAPTRGSEAAIAKVTTPQNMQRYVDVLTEARKYPGLMQGGYGWYIQDPLFQQMERVVGTQRAMQEYPQFAAFQGSHSPGSNVLTEIHRGTTAYQAAKEGWLPEYIQYGSKKKGVPIPPDVEARLAGVPGHLAHGAQTHGLENILAGIPMDTPKTTPYVNAAGVPQTGYSWQIPTLDAMMARSIGLPDVRTAKTLSGNTRLNLAARAGVDPATLSAHGRSGRDEPCRRAGRRLDSIWSADRRRNCARRTKAGAAGAADRASLRGAGASGHQEVTGASARRRLAGPGALVGAACGRTRSSSNAEWPLTRETTY